MKNELSQLVPKLILFGLKSISGRKLSLHVTLNTACGTGKLVKVDSKRMWLNLRKVGLPEDKNTNHTTRTTM